ncbi:MAG TPA: MFS transporter [Candidatus Nanopelagicaceae bacterium]|nr:MFS transporter [Candidatus Nanopelagicaceae bacterium]
MTETIEKEKFVYKRRIRASYGGRELFGQWISAAFGFYVFFFYENVIKLPVGLAALAFTLYSVWNAVNDPFVGWLMEKIHMPWEKKGFKRFPWMLIGVIPWLLSYMLIFMVPTNLYITESAVTANQWLIFAWYLGSLCLYDTMLTIYDVNVISLYPDKFRGLRERRSVQGYGTILGILGLVLAFTLPSLFFIDTYVAQTYVSASIFSVIIGFMFFLIIIPGIYEDKKVKDLYQSRIGTGEVQKVESFLSSTKRVIKDRTFMMKALHFFGYQVGGVMLQTSALYVSANILLMGDEAIIFLLGSMLLGALISTPFWTIIAHRINDNRKLSVIAAFLMFVAFVPLIFVWELIGWTISLFFFGIALGGHWYVDPPTMGDVLDDVAVRTGKSQQAIYYGFQSFFIKFGQSFIAITIAISHILTDYQEGQAIQQPLALFGIRIHTAIVPAILVLVTALLFWKFYKLTPDKVSENIKKLKEMGLR